jgi:plasmid stabilization system protein ParE
MMTLSYHGAVRREVEEACDWYDERKDGLGDEFFQELEAVLVLIAGNPQAFPKASEGRRKGSLRRFPYAVYYRVLADRVRILAVVHDRRHPLQGSRRK